MAAFALIGLGIAAQFAAFRFFHAEDFGASAQELVQGLEAAGNLLILFTGGVWFLLTLEKRARTRCGAAATLTPPCAS